MKKFTRKLLLVLAILIGCIGVSSVVAAQATPNSAQSLQNQIDQQLGGFAGEKGANLGQQQDPRIIVARLIKISLSVIGVIAVMFAVGGGFMIMTSNGNEEKVGGGKKILTYSVIGLAVILGAYSIVWLVYYGIYNSTQNPMSINQGSIYIRPNDSTLYNNADPIDNDTAIGGYQGDTIIQW